MSCGCSTGGDYSRSYVRSGYEMGASNSPDFSTVLMQAAYSGAVGAAEGYLLYGYNSQLLVPGLGSVSAPVGFGIHTLLGSVIGQYVDPMLQTTDTPPKPWIPGGQQEPILAGVAQVGTHMLAGNSGVTPLNAFLIGATSEYVGHLITGK